MNWRNKTGAGKPTFHPVASARMAQEVSGGKKGTDRADQPAGAGSLKIIAKGLGNKEIDEQLFVSERTLKSHVTHLLEKLNLRDRTQLAIYALRNNLASDD